MPTLKKYDFILGGNGYLLHRDKNGPRSWQRTGIPDTPAVEQPRIAAEYGGAPPQIEYPEVWNDWSGGYGFAYRHPRDENSYFGFLANPNTFHWSENFDARFSRQLVHCQKLKIPDARYGTLSIGVTNILDIPFPSLHTPSGIGGVYLFSSNGHLGRLYPTGLASPGSAFDLGPIGSWRSGIGRPAIFGSYIYIPGDDSASQFIKDTLDDTTLGQLGHATNGRGFRTAGNLLWQYMGLYASTNLGPGRRIYANNKADPVAVGDPVDWSATLTIGNAQRNINDMVPLGAQLFIGTEDGLYAGDASGTFYDIIGDLSGQANADNFRDLTVHNGQVVGQHVTGLYAYSPQSTQTAKVRQIGPVVQSNKSPVNGYMRCLEPAGPWLFAGLWNGSQGYVMAGFDSQGAGNYDWFPMQKLPAIARPQRLHIDGITSNSAGNPLANRFWIATDPSINTGGSAPLYYFEIPAMHGNPLMPSIGFTPNYANSARMDLGDTNGRAPLTPKIYREVEIDCDGLDGSQRWGLMYYMLDAGPRTLLGTFNTSPRSVLYFPAGNGSFVMGQSIELSMESYIAAGAEATTPVYRGIVLRQTYVPRSIDVITAIADLGDQMVDRQGSPMRKGSIQIGELENLIATGPARLTDILGVDQWVKVLAPVEQQEFWQEGENNPSVLATIKMAVMKFSGPASGG